MTNTDTQITDTQAKKKVVVLGSGPIRIGQGIEFDYASVHCVRALREAGYEAIIINNNPETVSTDFDTSDRLYFEPLTAEDVLHVIERESPIEGVIVQFGGQTAINLAKPLFEAGIPILGSSFDSIDLAEDRDRFEGLLRGLDIPKPPGRAVTSTEAAVEVADEVGYPVLVRPSYVLGGRGDGDRLQSGRSARIHALRRRHIGRCANPRGPLHRGEEAEVDVIADGRGAASCRASWSTLNEPACIQVIRWPSTRRRPSPSRR